MELYRNVTLESVQFHLKAFRVLKCIHLRTTAIPYEITKKIEPIHSMGPRVQTHLIPVGVDQIWALHFKDLI